MVHLNSGHKSSWSCANKLHRRRGTLQETPSLRPDEHGRCCPAGWLTVREGFGLLSGRTHDVTRLAQLVAEGGAQLQTWDGRKSRLHGRPFCEHVPYFRGVQCGFQGCESGRLPTRKSPREVPDSPKFAPHLLMMRTIFPRHQQCGWT